MTLAYKQDIDKLIQVVALMKGCNLCYMCLYEAVF